MKNIILQYKDALVSGYSHKTGKVYYTTDFQEAKKFSDVGANAFISEYTSKDSEFKHEGIRMHIIQRGKPFNLNMEKTDETSF